MRKDVKKMKTSTKATILLPIFFIIAACNMRTPTPSAPSTQDAVTPTQISDEEALRAALAAHLGANATDLTIVIDQNTGAHARGGVDNGYFLAAKVNGQWVIVADGQGALNCPAIIQYGFPASMVPECQNTNWVNQIHFKPGGTFAYVQKSIGAGEQHTYQIRALANQTMIVSVSSDQNDVFVGINGIQGGQQLVSTSDHTPYWIGTLPARSWVVAAGQVSKSLCGLNAISLRKRVDRSAIIGTL